MAAPYNILFEDTSHCYESPMPTPNDIDGSETPLHQSAGCRVVRIWERFVVKFGMYVDPIEAYNMLYVAESTTIPVPEVHAVYQRQEKQELVTYIVMQYVPGETLLSLWGKLDEGRKTVIARTLRTYFDQLRQLQHPQHPGHFGDIVLGSPLKGLFWGTLGADELKTALATEDELIEWIIRIYSLELGNGWAHKIRHHQHVLPTVLRGDGTPIFSHNDFRRSNIMMQPDGTLVILDWEFASWCPTYWEYSTATYADCHWYDDWHDYLRMILDEYPNQALWLSGIKTDIWS
ncbi:kinase-like domain-containing protein [Hypomontagnella submonticulosa]|nr:kinase-like domain-containing protein [Hypomontagnella submonticulosa]